MKLLQTPEEAAPRVAARWKAQYHHGGKWGEFRDGSAEVDYQKLLALGDAATPAAVEAIIGNKTWTDAETCSDCGLRPAVAEVGEEPDYESATAYLCAECVAALQKLVRAAPLPASAALQALIDKWRDAAALASMRIRSIVYRECANELEAALRHHNEEQK